MAYTGAKHFSKKDKSSINNISTSLLIHIGPIPLKSTNVSLDLYFGPGNFFFSRKKAPTFSQYSNLASIQFLANDAIKDSTYIQQLIGQKLDEG